jgi:hypothetical protein
MAIVLIMLTAVFVAVLGLQAYKQHRIRVLQRMHENEYNVAVTLWEYARTVKEQVDSSIRIGKGVLDFTNLSVPHSLGYKISIEMIGPYFRVYAVPAKYDRTGRLSFLADSTLNVRAADHKGQPASPEDDEYRGD